MKKTKCPKSVSILQCLFAAFFITASTLLAGCRSGSCMPRETLKITSTSRYQIVLPARWANPGLQKPCERGAQMLQQAFRQGLGLRIPIVREDKLLPGVKGIFLGDTRALRKTGVSLDKMAAFEYLIKEDSGNIFIAGIDRHYLNDRKNWDKRALQWSLISGTLNGIVNFAEQYLNVRFFNPGEIGTDYVKNVKSFEIPKNLEVRSKPRHMLSYTGFSQTPDPLYDYANQIFGRGIVQHWGGHSHNAAIPAAMFKTHPEYFILRNGKRICGAQRHYCLSNPAVEELIYQLGVKYFKRGAEIVSMGADDSYQPCECKNCFAIDPDPGERLWLFHLKLAKRLAKEWPGKKYLLTSYGPTSKPPRSFRKFLPNMMVEVAFYSPEDFKVWKKYSVPAGFTVYIYNWGAYNRQGYTPKRTPEYVMKQLKRFDDFGIKGMYRCGWGENRGLEGPVYYLFGKRIADPQFNAEKTLDEFYSRYYRGCSVPMKRFHQNLFRRLRLFADQDYHLGTPTVADPKAIIAAVYTPDLLQILDRDLSAAEKQTRDPKVKQRLKLVRTEFNYVKDLAAVIIHFNSYLTNPDWSSFARLEKAVNHRIAAINKLCDRNGFTKIDPAWPEVNLFQCRGGYLARGAGKNLLLRNGSLGAVIESPMNWNFKLLRSKGVLPAAGRKKCFAYKGKPELAAWNRIPWNDLSGIQLGPVREKSRFKVLYDEKNLYFLMESELRDPSRDYEKNRGAGGTDSMEIFLDPTASRELFYHFHFNPMKNSSVEGAWGLCQDPLDPKFRRYDRHWNGKWEYTPSIRKNIWQTSVTIPFKSLGALPPVPGASWLLNVGHTSYEIPGNWRSVELSLWSPNLESSGNFHDSNTFGELEFK